MTIACLNRSTVALKPGARFRNKRNTATLGLAWCWTGSVANIEMKPVPEGAHIQLVGNPDFVHEVHYLYSAS